MSKSTLNLNQRRALSRFAEMKEPAYPYQVSARIATCMALQRRGYLEFYFSEEELKCPSFNDWYRFTITDEGRKALTQ